MRRRCLKALLSHLVSEWRECHWLERPISTVDLWRLVNSLKKTFASFALRLATKRSQFRAVDDKSAAA